MNTFIFILKNELYKLLHKKKYFILLLIAVGFCAVRWGGNALALRLSDGIVKLAGNVTLEMLPVFCELFVPIIIFIASVDLFTGEYSSDTMKECLLQPVTRFKLLSAKSAAVFILGSTFLLAMYFICMIIQLILGGTAQNALITLLAYIIDIIPLLGITALAVFINVLLKAPSAAMLLSLAVYGVMKYAGIYVAASNSFLFTSFAKLHSLILGNAIPFHSILYKFGILAGSILILYSLSYIIFDSKDI